MIPEIHLEHSQLWQTKETQTAGRTFTFPIAAANETVGPTFAQDINADIPLIPAPTFPINDED